MTSPETPEPEDCKQCGHPFPPHLMVALYEDVTAGGIVVCPDDGCTCQATWASNGNPRPPLSHDDITALRIEFKAAILDNPPT